MSATRAAGRASPATGGKRAGGIQEGKVAFSLGGYYPSRFFSKSSILVAAAATDIVSFYLILILNDVVDW